MRTLSVSTRMEIHMSNLIKLITWSSLAHKDLLEPLSQGCDLDELYTEEYSKGTDEPVISSLLDRRIVDVYEGYFHCLGSTPHLTDNVRTCSPRIPFSVLTDDEGNKWMLEPDYYREM